MPRPDNEKKIDTHTHTHTHTRCLSLSFGLALNFSFITHYLDKKHAFIEFSGGIKLGTILCGELFGPSIGGLS
jgi:hypothetical protein